MPPGLQVPLRFLEDNAVNILQEEPFCHNVKLVPGKLTESAFNNLMQRPNTAVVVAEGGNSNSMRWFSTQSRAQNGCQTQVRQFPWFAPQTNSMNSTFKIVA